MDISSDENLIGCENKCEDGWSDEDIWSDEEEEDCTVISNDLWDSFNCTNIPYASEFIEQQISDSAVRLANEKSEQIYLASVQISRSSSCKRVQFCPEPHLVTVITV